MKIKSSEITPEHIYLSRREFIKGAGMLTGGAALLAACAPKQSSPAEVFEPRPVVTPSSLSSTDELGDSLTSFTDVTNYNNYYEFSLYKEKVAAQAQNFPTSPWSVSVGGLVNKPQTFDVDDLKKMYVQEERVYRLRCVEGWSMVIPWIGFSLNKLLAAVEPTSAAKYVRFEAILDPEKMSGQSSKWYTWPYVEGLRIDEAQNDLAMLATGLYGNDLLPQNGAPLRIVVPWKYGFKSIKAIVKIDLVETMPVSLWMDAAPREYGFYSNVNPEVPHPRWAQSSERRIGEISRRPTLKFNGYEEQVAQLYEGMDLRANY